MESTASCFPQVVISSEPGRDEATAAVSILSAKMHGLVAANNTSCPLRDEVSRSVGLVFVIGCVNRVDHLFGMDSRLAVLRLSGDMMRFGT